MELMNFAAACDCVGRPFGINAGAVGDGVMGAGVVLQAGIVFDTVRGLVCVCVDAARGRGSIARWALDYKQ